MLIWKFLLNASQVNESILYLPPNELAEYCGDRQKDREKLREREKQTERQTYGKFVFIIEYSLQ